MSLFPFRNISFCSCNEILVDIQVLSMSKLADKGKQHLRNNIKWGEKRKKKHAKSCPCLVLSLQFHIGYYLLIFVLLLKSILFCLLYRVLLLTFFMLCTLFILKKTLWHKQTLVLFILVSFYFFFFFMLFELFICLLYFLQQQNQDEKTNEQRMRSARKFPSVSCNIKKIIMARFSYFTVKKGRRGQWLNNSFWSTCVLCSILVMSCLFHNRR